MEFIFPTKDEIIEFFNTRHGFFPVIDIAVAIVVPRVQRSTPMDEEWKHIRKLLHELKAEGFLLVEGEGGDIYQEKFSSTPDRIKKYSEYVEKTKANIVKKITERKFPKPQTAIEKYSDEELLAVVRRAENTNVPGGLYQMADKELQIRHQQKMLEATKKEPQPVVTPVQVSGDYVAGDKVGRDKNINKTKSMKDNIPSWLQYMATIVAVLAFLWGIYIYFYPSSPVVTSPSTASTSTSVDLRNMLIGSIFDLVQDIQKIDKELLKEDFLQNSKGRIFEAEGVVLEIGKFESGEIWVTIRGAATDGSFETVECHFDDSWEKTLRSLLSTNKDQIKFGGEIGYYTKGWLVAQKCKILEVKN